MSKSFRFLLIIFAIGLALYALYPTVWWYFLSTEEEQRQTALSSSDLRDEVRAMANRDLTMLLELDGTDEVLPSALSYVEKLAKVYSKDNNDTTLKNWDVDDLKKVFPNRAEMLAVMEEYRLSSILTWIERKSRALSLGLDLNGGLNVVITPNQASLDDLVTTMLEDQFETRNKSQLESDVISRTVQALSGRIDQFGLSEPELRILNDLDIEVTIPVQGGQASDVPDINLVDDILKAKGSLEFHLVDQDETEKLADYLRSNPAAEYSYADGAIAGYQLLTGRHIAGFYEKDKYGLDERLGYLVLEDQLVLSGRNIVQASIDRSTTSGNWQVLYQLDGDGANDFKKLFTDYAGRMMAIVLSDKVVSYPRISENSDSSSINNRGVITGSFTSDEAQGLANVLNSGNLPVDLEIKSQSSVGATLGDDTIRSGLFSIMFGLLAVLIFMFIYYKLTGIIADLALLLNLLLLAALLAAMNSTLTMTSIAGIILTVGMSVDANVIIFERIKEELRSGKSRAIAIEAGFAKAFWTIMDANITTGIAAIFLSALGSGAVKGFAITLAWGIACSLFTAIFVSRFIFDFASESLKLKKISISWGSK